MIWMFLALACSRPPETHGVYRSGENAITPGARSGELKLWGPSGTVTRQASEGPGGSTLLGQAGPLWIATGDWPAPPKALAVEASLVERIGFRLAEVLGTKASGAKDAAKSAGVYVRSVVKVRQPDGPPLYIAAGTVDTSGEGQWAAPKGQERAGEACRAALVVTDHTAEKAVAQVELPLATSTCVIPLVVPPVDVDGDGVRDLLLYGQKDNKGFRTWFKLQKNGTLEKGLEESWEGIP